MTAEIAAEALVLLAAGKRPRKRSANLYGDIVMLIPSCSKWFIFFCSTFYSQSLGTPHSAESHLYLSCPDGQCTMKEMGKGEINPLETTRSGQQGWPWAGNRNADDGTSSTSKTSAQVGRLEVSEVPGGGVGGSACEADWCFPCSSPTCDSLCLPGAILTTLTRL